MRSGPRRPVAARGLDRTVVVPIHVLEPDARRPGPEAGLRARGNRGRESRLAGLQLGHRPVLPAHSVALEGEVGEPEELQSHQKERDPPEERETRALLRSGLSAG